MIAEPSSGTRTISRVGLLRGLAIGPASVPMHPVSIGFHDVVEDIRLATPIAPGHTMLYTLDRAQFRLHLEAIRRGSGPNAVGRIDCGGPAPVQPFVALTFDDGAISSYTSIAPELDLLGWPGYFLITTDWIGQRGFMDRFQIRDLEGRRHLIGTHSRTHPARMSQLGWKDLVREWSESCGRLSDVLGHPITIASVPGGYYSRRVAEAAAASGIKLLFTSEPTMRGRTVDGCLVLGRYSIRRHTPAGFSSSIVSGAIWPRSQQAAIWILKKAAKKLTGRFYERIRDRLLADAGDVGRPTG